MNFFNCGIKLSLGIEKFCPECGIKLKQIEAAAKGSRPSIDINATNGDITGIGLTGSGIISGKEVSYTVQGNVFNIQITRASR